MHCAMFSVAVAKQPRDGFRGQKDVFVGWMVGDGEGGIGVNQARTTRKESRKRGQICVEAES